MDNSLPLAGLLVLDMSQFLSGPYCSLRLADLGARVIKIERPVTGDLARQLYLSDTDLGGDSTLFHAINRGKESIALDLKNTSDISALKELAGRADVVIQNFRPGVADRLGIGPAVLRTNNPRLVVASISGYGQKGPWSDKPGQDLLAQARSGIMWLTGDATQGPVPMGLAVADILAGATAAQGILAALVRRGITGEGAHVETSLLEVLIDLQFEVLTTHLNDGGRLPRRAAENGAHAYLAAPYGVYQAADGWLTIAMTPLSVLAELLDLPGLLDWPDPAGWFTDRDRIKALIASRIRQGTVDHWLSRLEPADIWCAKVLDWPELLASEGFRNIDMLQTVLRAGTLPIRTTRAPLQIDGKRPSCTRAAPQVGANTAEIAAEFGLWPDGGH